MLIPDSETWGVFPCTDAKQLFPVAAVDQPEDDYDMNEAEKSVPSPPPVCILFHE